MTGRGTGTGTGVGRPVALIAVVGVLLGCLLGWVAGPSQVRLGVAQTGDADLAGRLRAVLGEGAGLRSVAAAEVTRSSITWAGLGNPDGNGNTAAPGDASQYELGSVTKTFTGALFAEAIKRDEVKADDTLAQHLPELRGTAAGGVSLRSLAQHTSGLPSLGDTAQAQLPSVVLNDNPYASSTVERLLADAAQAPVAADPAPRYSNFGVSLLGQALARAAGAPGFPTLVEQRILKPVGMTGTVFAGTGAEVPAGALPGSSGNGMPRPRWTGEGYLPAGTSTFTTITDMARWAQGQLNGTAPGVAALRPRADYAGNNRIGWLWLTNTTAQGGPITWHNGATAGFRSMLVLDLEAGRGVVLLGNTDTDLDSAAIALLRGGSAPADGTDWVAWGVAAVAVLFAALALRAAVRGKALVPILNSLLTAVFGLLMLWGYGPWTQVGGWLFGLPLGLVLAAVVLAALRVRALPLQPDRHAWASWLGVAVSLALVGFGIAMW